MTYPGPFRDLYTALKRGEVTRRQFIERATALGMTAGLALHIATPPRWPPRKHPRKQPKPRPRSLRSTPNPKSAAPGGELRILQWQAPSHLSAQQATGDKDGLGASLVSEPLMLRGPDAA